MKNFLLLKFFVAAKKLMSKLAVLDSSMDLNAATCRVRPCGCTGYLTATHEFERKRGCARHEYLHYLHIMIEKALILLRA